MKRPHAPRHARARGGLLLALATSLLACGVESRTVPHLESTASTTASLLWIQDATLLPDPAFTTDPTAIRFGWSVALNGDTALVGANDRNVASCDAQSPNDGNGQAYTFVQIDGAWSAQAKLVASDEDNGDQFGQAVALSGSWAIVGAPCQEPGPADTSQGIGEAYVFARIDDAWVELDTLAATANTALDWDDHFGAAVAIDGDRIAVGAPGRKSVFLFERNGLTWTLDDELTESTSGFGTSIALAGDTLLVGASNTRAYVFVHDGAWTLQSTLPPTGTQGGSFGTTVDLDHDGSGAIVGARNEGPAGAAFVYRRDANDTWSEEQKLEPFDPASTAFGRRVQLDGDTAVVADLTYDSYQGAAWTFQKQGNCGQTWCPGQKLVQADGESDDHFGYDLSLEGPTLLVGVARDNLVGPTAGSALVINEVATTSERCQSPSDCALGFCVDGLCCNQACDGPCSACDLPGSVGICTSLGTGEPGGCPDGQACNGGGECKTIEGEGCVPSQCLSGFCEDGVCCDLACDEPCARCDLEGSEGTCSPAPSGDLPQDDACPGYVCDGEGLGCPASCAPGGCAPNYVCNPDSDRCEPGASCVDDNTLALPNDAFQLCEPYRCIDGGCRIDCRSSSDCLGGYQCTNEGTCAAPTVFDRATGCTMSPQPRPPAAPWWLLLGAALAAHLRRRVSSRAP